jgi:threonine dehydrogenase-like Zn-dependent dehydrogenase
MSSKYEIYRKANYPLPRQTWAWNLYGAGLDNLGRDGSPEPLPFPPDPGDDQLLVRIDSVGVCFSDIKIMKQGGSHPKLYNRDLANDPTRLGHEVSLTIVKVGANLQDRYQPGQRLAVQPDIYQRGRSTAYGYTVPGGLIQYHLIGPEVLQTDEGACLLPLEEQMGYAESSLLEPWGCVMAAYTQRRRLEPKVGGKMWIVGYPDDDAPYQFSTGLEAPATIVLSGASPQVLALVRQNGAEVVERNGLEIEDYAALSQEITGGAGFDDIVVLNPRSAEQVSAIARLIARRGTLNMVGRTPLDGAVQADLGRLHYDYIAFVGNQGPDIAASYGEARNRCELRSGGVAVFVGAGGPMGQMHVQRAIEQPDGPRLVIATEVSDERLQTLMDRFGPLAQKNRRKLLVFNPNTAGENLYDFVMYHTEGQGADDVVVSVPLASLMEEAAAVMKPDGMLVLFAGVPNGTLGCLNLSNVYLHNAQYTGTSGLTIHDQETVMQRAVEGALSPGRSVAAIGGLEVVRDALTAVMEGSYPGKIVIFPQIHNLPLMGVNELKTKLPAVALGLGEGDVWTPQAEQALIEAFWSPPEETK